MRPKKNVDKLTFSMRDEENEQQRSHQRVILAKSILKDEITYQRSDSNQQSRVPKSVPEICEY